VELRLETLERQGIITPLESNERDDPLVPILKADADYKIRSEIPVAKD